MAFRLKKKWVKKFYSQNISLHILEKNKQYTWEVKEKKSTKQKTNQWTCSNIQSTSIQMKQISHKTNK